MRLHKLNLLVMYHIPPAGYSAKGVRKMMESRTLTAMSAIADQGRYAGWCWFSLLVIFLSIY